MLFWQSRGVVQNKSGGFFFALLLSHSHLRFSWMQLALKERKLTLCKTLLFSLKNSHGSYDENKNASWFFFFLLLSLLLFFSRKAVCNHWVSFFCTPKARSYIRIIPGFDPMGGAALCFFISPSCQFFYRCGKIGKKNFWTSFFDWIVSGVYVSTKILQFRLRLKCTSLRLLSCCASSNCDSNTVMHFARLAEDEFLPISSCLCTKTNNVNKHAGLKYDFCGKTWSIHLLRSTFDSLLDKTSPDTIAVSTCVLASAPYTHKDTEFGLGALVWQPQPSFSISDR